MVGFSDFIACLVCRSREGEREFEEEDEAVDELDELEEEELEKEFREEACCWLLWLLFALVFRIWLLWLSASVKWSNGLLNDIAIWFLLLFVRASGLLWLFRILKLYRWKFWQ